MPTRHFGSRNTDHRRTKKEFKTAKFGVEDFGVRLSDNSGALIIRIGFWGSMLL